MNFENYITDLTQYRQTLEAIPAITEKIDAVLQTDAALTNHQFPPVLPKLDFDETTQKYITEYLSGQSPEKVNEILSTSEDVYQLLSNFRDYLVMTYGMFSYVSGPWLASLSNYIGNRTTLEVMAGNGYISAGLRALRPDRLVAAVDTLDWSNQPNKEPNPITDVVKMDVMEAVDGFSEESKVIIMSWAPDTSTIDLAVLNTLRDTGWLNDGGELIVIGERNGATNSQDFWESAKLTEIPELNLYHHSFDLIDERVYKVE